MRLKRISLPKSAWALLALLNLVVGVGFWFWVDTQRPGTDWQEVAAFASGFTAYQQDSIVPPSFQESAHQLGIDPEPERRQAAQDNPKGDPNRFAFWGAATSRRIEELAAAERRYNFLRQYRIPVAVAAGACALLFAALARQKREIHNG